MREDGTGWKHGATSSISLPYQQCEAEPNFGDGMILELIVASTSPSNESYRR
jgi:hypothetical protein